LFFWIEQDTVPSLELSGRWLSCIGAVGEPVERRFADTFHAQMRATDNGNEAVVLQLTLPLANCILARSKALGASSSRQEHSVLGLAVVGPAQLEEHASRTNRQGFVSLGTHSMSVYRHKRW